LTFADSYLYFSGVLNFYSFGKPFMAIEQVTEDIVYVTLPRTPHINCELEPVNNLIVSGRLCHVILDFELVQVITSSSISALLILRNLLQNHGRQLIFCSMGFLTKCEFTTTGLSHYFRFVPNKAAALKTLRREGTPA
jgi:anti-anti-sigma regulatory factor